MAEESNADLSLVGKHVHGRTTTGRYAIEHEHAWPHHPHSHILRAICQRPECEGCPTHNIHAAPQDSNDGSLPLS